MIRCPICHESNFFENYSTSTALYSPIKYINGEQQYNDPNYHTYYCTCANCGNDFSYTIGPNNEPQYNWTDETVVKKNVDTITITAQEIYEARVKELKNRIAQLQKELQELEFSGNYLIEIAPSTYKSNATCGE